MKKVVIVDYGIGNILSVKRAFEHCGADVLVSDNPNDILCAQRLVVPGVGAFKDCVSTLAQKSLKNVLLEFSATRRPYLGICVGMQMLLDESEEFGLNKGLSLIGGRVCKISDSVKYKIPFVGWKSLKIMTNNDLFHHISQADRFYFTHSYSANPNNKEDLLAYYDYDAINVTAVVGKDNVYGTQFHPEKSGAAGLQIIKNFLKL